jgi:hypothetical protein
LTGAIVINQKTNAAMQENKNAGMQQAADSNRVTRKFLHLLSLIFLP